MMIYKDIGMHEALICTFTGYTKLTGNMEYRMGILFELGLFSCAISSKKYSKST